MFAAEGMVFSEEDPINPATIALCLSNQGRKSVVEQSYTQWPKKNATSSQGDAKQDGRQELHQLLTFKKTMRMLKGINNHVCN